MSRLETIFSVLRRRPRCVDRPSSSRRVPRHRRLALEQLEDRRVLSAVLLSGHEQLLLELVNRARSDPAAEAAMFRIDLNAGLDPGTITTDPKQPLAPHQSLVVAAGLHAQDMLDNDFFSHDNLQGETPSDRAKAAGYPNSVGENIAWSGTTGVLDRTAQVYARHESLFRSEGHRENMLLGGYRELGTGVRFGEFQGFNAIMVAEEFGNRGGNRFITGVAYVDSVTNDHFYSVGEGLPNVAVTAVRVSDGMIFTTATGPAGGYSLQVPSGSYSITALVGQFPIPIVHDDIVVSSANVKIDFIPNDTLVRPDRPADVSLTAASSSQIDVSWTDAAGEDGYRVYRWNGSEGELIATLPADSTSFSVGGLLPSTRVSISVEAYNLVGSGYAAWASATTLLDRPTKPGGFTALGVSASQVDLSWSDSEGEDGYRIYQWRSTGSILLATLPAGSTGYSVKSLAAGKGFWFSVESFNAAGSGWAQWTSATTLASRPSRPGDFSALTVSSSQVDLAWNDASGEDGYRVYQWQSGGGVLIATLPSGSTGYAVQSLASNTSHWFSVEAFNSAGSSYAPWTSAVTLDPSAPTSPPSSPTPILLAGVAADRIAITWTNSSQEDGYRLYQWSGSGVLIGSFAADVTSFSIQSLQPQTTYWFSVEAFNSLGSRYAPWTSFSTTAIAAFTSEK